MSPPFPSRPILAVLAATLFWTTPPASGAQTIGTISAVVDGEPYTWYVVKGELRGGPYASGVWYEPTPDDTVVMAGGFETEDPPFDTFEFEGEMPISYGTYQGSTVAILVDPPTGETSFTLAFPNESFNASTVTLQRKASLENVMETAYELTEGTLEVTRVEVTGARGRLEGRFSGTFELLMGGGTIQVTDGTFSVEGIPNIEEIRRL